MKKPNQAILCAVLAAVCYGISVPFSTLLLRVIHPTFLAALLYLGAAGGMLLLRLFSAGAAEKEEAPLGREDGWYVAGMILLDIAAPVLLMWGLSLSTPATVSLLNNFEIVATALIARWAFGEAVGRRIWLALGLITLGSVLLSVNDWRSLSFSSGALLALLACVCWGLENNCTRMLALKNPLQIVLVKGLGSGCGALLLAAVWGGIGWHAAILSALVLGAVAYGGSVYFYILAQRELGAARTSAYYALAPFVGVVLSFVLVGQEVSFSFGAAALFMALGVYLAVNEKHNHSHTHERLAHCHRHNHQDGHHLHTHPYPVAAEHSHYHVHEPMTHSHEHRPDLHHTHTHTQ